MVHDQRWQVRGRKTPHAAERHVDTNARRRRKFQTRDHNC